MGKGKALDELTKQQVIYLWMDKNNTQMQIAKRLGIGTSTVKKVIGEYASTGAHEPPAHMEIPEAAPIAGKESADVEEKFVNAEERHSGTDSDTEKDTLDTKSDTIESLPDAVYKALLAKLNDIQFDIEEHEQRIAELTDEIRQLKHDRDEIIDWKDKYEH